jgi:hemoglobin/transferrin/lactoferrin receptor protein
LGGEDNQQYATPDGMPAWYTLNLRLNYRLTDRLTIQGGIDNLLDTQYRTFASGINAPGRNFMLTLRFHQKAG